METTYKGKMLLIDEVDLPILLGHAWSWTGGYLAAKVQEGSRRKSIMLHRMIMGTPKGMHTDHINRIRYDNRRCNLRICTPQDNALNRTLWNEHPGVTWNKKRQKWQVVIKDGGRCRWGGYFDSEDAATASAQAILSHRVLALNPL